MIYGNGIEISSLEKEIGISEKNKTGVSAVNPINLNEEKSIIEVVAPKYQKEIAGELEAELGISTQIDEFPEIEKTPAPITPTAKAPDGYTGFWGLMRSAGEDIGTGLMEAPRALIGGVRDASQDVIDLIYKGGKSIRESVKDIAPEWMKYNLIYDNGTLRLGYPDEPLPELKLKEIPKQETTTGSIIRGISEFASAMVPAGRILKSAGVVNGVLRSATAGAIADLTITSEGDKRLSDLIQQYPGLENPITDYLSTKPDDTLAETKFKTAIEGLALGASGELLLGGLRKLKSAHSAPTAGQLIITDGIKEIAPKLEQFTGSIKSILNDLPPDLRLRIENKIEQLDSLPGTLEQMKSGGIPSADIINKLEYDTNQNILGITDMINRYSPEKGVEIKKLADVVTDTINNTTSVAGDFASGVARGQAFQNKYQTLIGNPNEPIKDIAGNINFAHIDTDDDIKKVIQLMAEEPEVKAATRGKIDNKKLQELAEGCGITVDDLLSRQTGEAWNAEKILAARNLMLASADKVRDISLLVADGAGEAEKLALYRHIALHRSIVSQISGLGAEAGRSLQQFNVAVRGVGKDITAINDFIRNLENSEVSIEKIAESIKMMQDPIKLAKFLSEPQKLTTLEAFTKFRTACLLTSPKTHAVNVVSNVLNTFWQIPERLLASHMKIGEGADRVAKQEWKHLAYGTMMGFKDAIKLASTWNFWKQGGSTHEVTRISPRTISRETMPALGAVADLLGKWCDIPMKALGAEDEFFKMVGHRGESHAIAYRIADSEGLSGKEAAIRIKDLIDNPTPEMEKAVGDYQRYITFQQKTDGIFKAMENVANAHPSMRLMLPFVRTPSNIWLETVERTPLAPFTHSYKEAIKKGGVDAQIAMARYRLGTGMFSMVGMLAAGGYITSGGPIDPALKRAKMTSGWQPYSFKVDDKFYSFMKLEPISGIMELATDAIDVISATVDAKQADNIIRDVGLVIGHYLTDRTYFKNISDMLEMIFEPTSQSTSKYLSKLIGSAHPLGQAGIWSNQYLVGDNIMRDARTWIDQLLIRTPGLSKEVPPLVDFWGDSIPIKPGIGPDALSPIAYSIEKKDPVSQALLESDIKLRMPKRVMTFGGHGTTGIPLNATEYNAFVRASNGRAKPYLEQVVKSSDYKKASNEIKQLMFDNILKGYRQLAKQEIYNSFPVLKQKVDSRREEYIKTFKMD